MLHESSRLHSSARIILGILDPQAGELGYAQATHRDGNCAYVQLLAMTIEIMMSAIAIDGSEIRKTVPYSIGSPTYTEVFRHFHLYIYPNVLINIPTFSI